MNKKNLSGGNSAVVPPDTMPNSEVKCRSADGSVGSPHVRVGSCQILIILNHLFGGFFEFLLFKFITILYCLFSRDLLLLTDN